MMDDQHMELISVIIPVFNAEKSISKCVKSVQSQSYENFELLLIDDGSTDNSGKICDDFSRKDSRIKVFHQKNKGASGARNAGLDRCKGTYIAFIDVDDYVEESYLQDMYSAMLRYDVELVRTAAYRNNKILNYGLHYGVDDVRLLPLEEMKNLSVLAFVWSLLIKRSLVGKLRFDENIHYNEDKLFVTECFFQSDLKKILVLNKPLYHQEIRDGSLSNHGISKSRLTALVAAKKISELFDNYAKGCMLGLLNEYMSKYSLYREIVISPEKKRYRHLLESLRTDIRSMQKLGLRAESKKDYVKEYLFIKNPEIMLFFARVIKKIGVGKNE